MVNIKVRAPSGDIQVDAQPEWSVMDLKKHVAPKVDVEDPTRIKLIFMARVLKDNNKLSELNIGEDQVVHLIVRAPDAPPPPSASSAPNASTSNNNAQQDEMPRQESTSSFGGGGAAPNPFGGVDIGSMLQGVMGSLGPMMAQMGQNVNATSFTQTTTTSNGNTTTTSSTSSAPRSQPEAQNTQQTAFQQANTQGTPSANSSEPRTQPQPQAASQPQPQPQAASQPQPQPQAQSRAQPQPQAQAQQQQAPQPPRFPQPATHPIAGVHVHVHVTLDELEQLPNRLQRFAEQSPPQPPVHVQVHRQAAQGPINIGTAMNSAMQNIQQSVAGAAGRAATTVNEVFHRTNSGDNASPPAATTPQAAASTASPTAAAPGAPRESISQLARRAGVDDMEGMKGASIFEELMKQVCDCMDMPDMIRVFNGDWAPTQKAREPLKKFILEELGDNTSDEARLYMAQTTAHTAASSLADNPEFMNGTAPRQRENRNFLRSTESVIRAAAKELIDLTLHEGAPNHFSSNLRPLIVRYAGLALDYCDREMFRNGRADTDEVLKFAINRALKKAVEQYPQFAPMVTMGGPMMANFVRNWHHEYCANMRRTGDDAIMEQDAPTFSAAFLAKRKAVAEKEKEATRAAPSLAADPDDALLDAAFDEANDAPSATTSNAADSEAITALREALTAAGVTGPDAAAILDGARRDAATGPSTATLSAEYKALYDNKGVDEE